MTEKRKDVQRSAKEELSSPAVLRSEKRARALLAWLIEPGDRDLGQWVAAAGAVEVAEKLSRGEGVKHLAERTQRRLNGCDPWEKALQLAHMTGRCGGQFITPDEDIWPKCLQDLCELEDTWPPHGLWVRGSALPLVRDRSVSVVGARAATDYGVFVAREISYGLAARGFAVVSGAAYGIDAAAHRGALAAEGVTVAVLACGIDIPYPPGNLGLVQRLSEKGGLVVSEWPPGTRPARHRFLVRNRVIAALTSGTVVVEAARRSGSLLTARRAAELGRDLMAVPGAVTSAMSEGSHEMVRRWRAELVTNAEQIIEQVSPLGEGLASLPSACEDPRDALTDASKELLDAFRAGKVVGVHELAVETGKREEEVLMVLKELVAGAWIEPVEEGWRLASVALQRSSPPQALSVR